MEKRINKKFENYITTLKENIREKSIELGMNDEKMNDLIQYIYNYERMTLNKDDFMKRKRVKNVVPYFERCCAKRANGEQCTRRKKEECEYCGTHMKGTPHGLVEDEENKQTMQKIELWAQEIMGIVYYLDKFGNVYQAEDIVNNKVNPKVISKYTKTKMENGEDVYTILWNTSDL
jgi:hypothetical protein|uniref:Uncharacterized protein n=1 Tax=viral metagenome TaxID=1070528 RepID=A0A6C0DHB4_9ZZZZ